jgi:hypothetical protein
VLYSSENWAIKARVSRTITAAEIKYVRKSGIHLTWMDCTTNTAITKERNKSTNFGLKNGNTERKVVATYV